MLIRRDLALPADPDAFEAAQRRLAREVILRRGPSALRCVAAADVAYSKEGPERACAVAIRMDAETLEVLEIATWQGPPPHAYVPGLFALREAGCLIPALERLAGPVDLLLVDGQGVAHPRGFGLACQLGLTFDLPTVGVAKRRLYGSHEPPGEAAGSVADLLDDDGARIGAVVRTQDGVRPVFVSPGHRIDVDAAARIALQLRSPHRILAPIREADLRTRDLRDGRMAPTG